MAACRQLTLALLKPDVTANPLVHLAIQNMIQRTGFDVIQDRWIRMTSSDAHRFYAEHKDRFFFGRLVTFISSGPCHALILAHQDAVARWRSLLGPTKVYRTAYLQPFSIRGRYGLSDTRNCAHGSDSTETARREIQFFFPEFDLEDLEQIQNGGNDLPGHRIVQELHRSEAGLVIRSTNS